jgi:hypothetical protein
LKNLSKYIAGLIILISAILMLACVKDGHEWGDDFALYISQAKAIINLSIYKLYGWNRFSMENSGNPGPYLYPNGFPLLLSPVYYFFGNNFIIMKLFCGVFFLMSIPVMFVVFKRHFTNRFYPFFIVITIGFSWYYVSFADNVTSDLPFFLFSFLSIMLMNKKNTLLNQLLVGGSIFFAYSIRDVGIFLIPALMFYNAQQIFIIKKEIKKLWLFTIPYLVFIFSFAIAFIFLPHGGANHFEMLFSKFSIAGMWSKTLYYLYFISNSLFIRIRFFIPFLLLAFIGMYSTWRDTLYMTVYIFLIFIILIIWPANQGIRFLFPVIPFIVFFSLKGMISVYDYYNLNKKSLVIGLATYAAIISLLNFQQISYYNKTDSNQCCTPELLQVYKYISDNIPKDDIVAFIKPRALRLFTDRNSIFADISDYDSSPAKYLLINKNAFQSSNASHKLIFQTKNYLLLSK